MQSSVFVMILLSLLIFFLIVFANEINNTPLSSKSKLQIGIKLRVKNCSVKTKKGDFLHVHYTGYLEDGTEIDSSRYRDVPLTFALGSGQVIKGWDQGLIGMCEGERRKLVIPSELAYGKMGISSIIPPDAGLMFDIELEKIERRKNFKLGY